MQRRAARLCLFATLLASLGACAQFNDGGVVGTGRRAATAA